MTIGESHRDLIRDRASPLRAAPDTRSISTPRSSTSTRCRFFWMSLVEFGGKCGIQDVMGVDPESFLWVISLPINQILQYSSSVSGIQNLSDLVSLLAIHNDGRCTLIRDLLLVPLSSRTTDGLKQGDMKGG